MDNRSISFWLIGLVLAAIIALFSLKVTPFFQQLQPEVGYIAVADVRGIDVYHKGLPYTLNYEQQNKLLTYLNQSQPVKADFSSPSSEVPDIEKILIYRFDASTIELRPLFYSGQNIVYAAPVWNHNGNMRDVSQGGLLKLLSDTFDP